MTLHVWTVIVTAVYLLLIVALLYRVPGVRMGLTLLSALAVVADVVNIPQILDARADGYYVHDYQSLLIQSVPVLSLTILIAVNSPSARRYLATPRT